MPPRLLSRLSQPISTIANSITTSSSIPSFLLPFLHLQSRNASILGSLSDRPGAYSRKIRRGRGPSSGKGGKSGRGSDGQKQHGGVPAGFNGGQTPDHIVHGKYGFKNLHAVEMSPINLDRIQEWIDQGRLDASKPITLAELSKSRAVHSIKDGIKLLANGASTLKQPIHIVVSRASQTAIAAVEALGGTVTTRFYTPLAMLRIRKGEMHPYVSMKWDQTGINRPALMVEGADQLESRVKAMGYEYRLPDPSGRKDIEYYRDPKNRGYLAHTLEEGENPNLYWKRVLSPEQVKVLLHKKQRGTASKPGIDLENKLW